jgi:twitching motility protein PilT
MTEKKINKYLYLMNDRGASDFHLVVGKPPMFRLLGEIEPLKQKVTTQIDFNSLISEIMPEKSMVHFRESGDCDFAYEIPGLARFRINVYKQENGHGAAFRLIPLKALSFEQLGLPSCVKRFTRYDRGLVLVTGPTGSGKSTTLASIMHILNSEKNLHIITIEDPIEFVHRNIRSIFTQRELGHSMRSFSEALKGAIRENPDVILVGEMRDLETMQMALHAAEVGLLVFSTMHTNSASATVDRLVNVFPPEEQEVVRNVLGGTLRGILSQQLLPRKTGGRIPAIEILFGSPALANLIREGKAGQIENLLKTGKREGMISMDDCLLDLVKRGDIEPLIAYEKSIHKENFRKAMKMELGISVISEAEEIGLK